MPKITDTYALAYQCCDQVLQETERFPTIDSIRERIGVNSPTTIKKAINDWTVAFARKHFENLHRPDLPTQLQDATESLWRLALQQAEQHFESQKQQFQTERDALQQQLVSEQGRAAQCETKLADLHTQQTAVEQENSRLTQEIEQCTQDNGALTQQLAEAQRLIEQRQQQHTHDINQLQRQLEQETQWAQRRILEERELQAAHWHEKVSHLEALNQALHQNVQHATQNTRQCRENHQALQQRCAQLENALADARRQLTEPVWKRKRSPLR